VNILGVSAFYHDSAAALVRDGRLVAAAQEERFTRRKHDDPPAGQRHALLPGRPGRGARATSTPVVYYDKPVSTFVRLLRTYLRAGPAGLSTFTQAMPLWLRQKLWIPYEIQRGLNAIGHEMPEALYFTEHP
jgi:carbamoyltransferase